MRLKFILSFLTCLFIISCHSQTEASDMLDQFKWKNRPVLLFTSSEENADYLHQLEIFKTNSAILMERDIVLLSITHDEIIDSTGSLDNQKAQSLRDVYAINSDFTVILIGKDGGEKLRENSPVNIKTLTKLIDSMPMRQSEMSQAR